MSGYTKVNLRDVEDQAPSFGFAPDLEARFASSALDLGSSGISYQRLAPNFRLPFGHRHKEQEEIYLVVAGSGRVKLDDEVIELRQWDALRLPPEIMRNVEAGPEGVELIAFGAPKLASPQADVEMTPNWWAD